MREAVADFLNPATAFFSASVGASFILNPACNVGYWALNGRADPSDEGRL
jgi:hypothetical protein